MIYEEKFSQWLWEQDTESLLQILNLSDNDLLEFNYYRINVTKEELETTFGNKIEEYFENAIWEG